jgi:hypothetical protein
MNASGAYSLHSLLSGLYTRRLLGSREKRRIRVDLLRRQIVACASHADHRDGRSCHRRCRCRTRRGRADHGEMFAAPGGMPPSDIAVCLFSGGEVAPRRCSDSAVDGSYTFQGLPSGSYEVGYSLDTRKSRAWTPPPPTTATRRSTTRGRHAGASCHDLAFCPREVEGVDAHLSGPSILSRSVTAPLVGIPVSAGAAVVREPEPRRRAARRRNAGSRLRGKSVASTPTNVRSQSPIRAQPERAVMP